MHNEYDDEDKMIEKILEKESKIRTLLGAFGAGFGGALYQDGATLPLDLSGPQEVKVEEYDIAATGDTVDDRTDFTEDEGNAIFDILVGSIPSYPDEEKRKLGIAALRKLRNLGLGADTIIRIPEYIG